MRVLVVDIGGTNVRLLATGAEVPRKFPSGRALTPRQLVANIKTVAADWQYDAVTLGYPGQLRGDRIVVEPHNLEVPPGGRLGDNANAFVGGFRLWENGTTQRPPARPPSRRRSPRAARA